MDLNPFVRATLPTPWRNKSDEGAAVGVRCQDSEPWMSDSNYATWIRRPLNSTHSPTFKSYCFTAELSHAVLTKADQKRGVREAHGNLMDTCPTSMDPSRILFYAGFRYLRICGRRFTVCALLWLQHTSCRFCMLPIAASQPSL